MKKNNIYLATKLFSFYDRYASTNMYEAVLNSKKYSSSQIYLPFRDSNMKVSKQGNVAKNNDKLIGGCVVATKTKGCNMLEDRDDLAVLWDIRVSEGYKHQGIGQHLFDLAINYCKTNNFKQFKIECQNTNPNAVNFYHKQGATLCAINEYAYNDCPNETQLLWYIDL